MNPRSIRFRLIAWYAGLLTGVFLLLAGLMFGELNRYLSASLHNTLARRAHLIADTLVKDVKQTGDAFVVSEIQSLYAPETNDRFIRITRADGSVLYKSGSPKDQSFEPAVVPALRPPPQEDEFRKVALPDHKTLLVAALNCQAENGDRYLIEVGTAGMPLDRMLDRLLMLFAIGLPIVVLVGIGGGYVLVGRALAPVHQIARKAEEITQHNLGERLPVARSAAELEQLTVSLNHMIGRLEDAVLNSKRFVADASHELRTPLTVLRAELESAVADKRLAADTRETFGSLLEEVDRLAGIVDQLCALSRLDAGEARAEWTQFDLAELVTSTTDQMSLLAEDKEIAVACEAKTPVLVAGDRSRLKQVVVNLLDNAIKYTPAHGRIALRVAAVNGHALLEVTDTGIGIPAEALPHVFRRFFRVDKARTRDPGGAGLGLAIVKSICAAHGAEVDAQSQDGGSRFRVTLPLATGLITKEL